MRNFFIAAFLLGFLLSWLPQNTQAQETENISHPKILILLKEDKPQHLRDLIQEIQTQTHHALLEEHHLPLTHTYVLSLPSDLSKERYEVVVEALKKHHHVQILETDDIISAHLKPNDPSFKSQWAMTNPNGIGAEKAWDSLTSLNKNFIIAVIDSGVDTTHEDLTANLWNNPKEIPGNGIDDDGNGYVDDIWGYDFLNNTANITDKSGHGSMVTGIIAAIGNNNKGVAGLAWNAQVMTLSVLDEKGNSNISTSVEAIEYAIKNGAQIINLSWGNIPNGPPSQFLEKAILEANKKGVLVIASAGNTLPGPGKNNDLDAQKAVYPASYPDPNIISVASSNMQGDLSGFSNYGPKTTHVAAPGERILTTFQGGTYEYFYGTSAAAPYVTATAALLWSLNPSLKHTDIKKLILGSTDASSGLEGKLLTGGRINLANAIAASPAGGGNLLASSNNFQDTTGPVSKSSGSCNLQNSASEDTSIIFLILGMGTIWILLRKKISGGRSLLN